MPLSMAKVGDIKIISKLTGTDESKRRLQELGFVPGSSVEVVGQNSSGLIVLVKGVRIAINKGLVSKILVE